MFAFSSFSGFFIVLFCSFIISALVAWGVMRIFFKDAGGVSVVQEEKHIEEKHTEVRKEKLGRSRVKLALVGLIFFVVGISIIQSLLG